VESGHATIFATVSDESAGGVTRVEAFYTTGGPWTFVQLARIAGVPNAWRATVATNAAKVEAGFVAQDAAANTGWMTGKGSLIDSVTPSASQPSIVISRPLDGGTYTVGQSVPSSYACSGAGGVASCSGPVANGAGADTSSIGQKQFTVTATPLAGATASKTAKYSVAYNFGGFQAPIAPSGLTPATPGSAVPVKFSLQGSFGTAILASGYPRSGSVPCTGGTVVGDPTSTSGKSGLQYDASTDTYTYVWKTEKSWMGCRQLVVVLNDGVVHRANFKFK
jgi:hypothetical protein